jgi:hypothetical protein
MNVAKQARIRPTNSVVRAVSYDHNFLQYLPMGAIIKLFTVVIYDHKFYNICQWGTKIKLCTVVIYDHKFLQYLPMGAIIKLFTVVIYDHNLFYRIVRKSERCFLLSLLPYQEQGSHSSVLLTSLFSLFLSINISTNGQIHTF